MSYLWLEPFNLWLSTAFESVANFQLLAETLSLLIINVGYVNAVSENQIILFVKRIVL